MGVDHLGTGLEAAGVPGAPRDGQVREGVAYDVLPVPADFPPGEAAVTVIVEIEDEIQIPQGNIPLAMQD
jgi:hypothetical protein